MAAVATTSAVRGNLATQNRGGETRTQTQTQTQPRTVSTRLQPVLHLRGEDGGPATGSGNGRRIQWADDVVDNEGLGRKSSKVCCIYHAPKPIDESSDESSSDDSSGSDSEVDDGGARPVGGSKKGCGGGGKKNAHHDHKHDHGKGKGKGKGNAYEKVPKPKGGGSVDIRGN